MQRLHLISIGNSHCGDKTIIRPSHLYNGVFYIGKMISLYWIGALLLCAISSSPAMIRAPLGVTLNNFPRYGVQCKMLISFVIPLKTQPGMGCLWAEFPKLDDWVPRSSPQWPLKTSSTGCLPAQPGLDIYSGKSRQMYTLRGQNEWNGRLEPKRQRIHVLPEQQIMKLFIYKFFRNIYYIYICIYIYFCCCNRISQFSLNRIHIQK